MDFGYEFTSGNPNSSGTFDALFTIDAADDPQVTFDIGSQGVFLGFFDDLSANIPSGGAWPTNSFQSVIPGSGVADVTGAAPLPSTLSLMGLGLVATGLWRRRMRSTRR
jgi:hypothetical protein